MYVQETHIPIYTEKDRCWVEGSWHKDVILARDWLAADYGQLVLVAPSLPQSDYHGTGQLIPIGIDDDIRVIPSFNKHCGLIRFWLSQRQRWIQDVREACKDAKVVHCSASEGEMMLGFIAHACGARTPAVSLLIGPDMDPHVTQTANLKGRIRTALFDYNMRRALPKADLVLLKEGLVCDRYEKLSSHVETFCHSMHSKDDVVSEEIITKRFAKPSTRLRAVYAGRLIRRKGLHVSLEAIAAARQNGSEIEYHIFGDGSQTDALKQQAESLKIEDLVTFHGFVSYGHDFLLRLAEFDLLFFMPTEEDTPRMLYDSMAAGLPVLGSNIPFLHLRINKEKLGHLVEIGDTQAAARKLSELDRDRSALVHYAQNARKAGLYHAVEEWWHRRADWTKAAYERKP